MVAVKCLSVTVQVIYFMAFRDYSVHLESFENGTLLKPVFGVRGGGAGRGGAQLDQCCTVHYW